jgi:hypothetical protein
MVCCRMPVMRVVRKATHGAVPVRSATCQATFTAIKTYLGSFETQTIYLKEMVDIPEAILGVSQVAKSLSVAVFSK